jgi:HSP20 family protein
MTNIVFRPNRVVTQPRINPYFNNHFNMVNQKGSLPNTINPSRIHSNIIEFETKFEIQLALPGYSKENIAIKIENNNLIVSTEPLATQEMKYLKQEINPTKLSRSFIIPENVNIEDISAVMTNGILSISILKVEKPSPLNITIK